MKNGRKKKEEIFIAKWTNNWIKVYKKYLIKKNRKKYERKRKVKKEEKEKHAESREGIKVNLWKYNEHKMY